MEPLKGQGVLKTAAIFGSNAGGKSNFVKAIELGKKLVLRGTRPDDPIEYYPFRLNNESKKKDTTISYQILCNSKKYEYGFRYNADSIKEEWLEIITKNSRNVIFKRDTENSQFDISYLLKINPKEEHQQFLTFLAKATPLRQLFLHEVLSRNTDENVSNINDLKAIISWFAFSLKIIFPSTTYKQGVLLKADSNEDLKRVFAALLRYFNTGIDSVKLIDVEFDKLGIPEALQRTIKNDLSKNQSEESFGTLHFENNLFLLNYANNDVKAKKLMTVHIKNGIKSDIELFSLEDESDGTKRLFDYIPLILDLVLGDKVFIVDEIERSIHPALINQLMYLFYKYSTDVKSQLIFTTHESTLMDLKLLRRDEIWFVAKNNNGNSNIDRMDQKFDVRFDKTLQNDYLKGLFGGIPHFGDEEEIQKLFNNLRQKEIQEKQLLANKS